MKRNSIKKGNEIRERIKKRSETEQHEITERIKIELNKLKRPKINIVLFVMIINHKAAIL